MKASDSKRLWMQTNDSQPLIEKNRAAYIYIHIRTFHFRSVLVYTPTIINISHDYFNKHQMSSPSIYQNGTSQRSPFPMIFGRWDEFLINKLEFPTVFLWFSYEMTISFDDPAQSCALPRASNGQDLSAVLYPNDATYEGKELRLRQQQLGEFSAGKGRRGCCFR